MPVRGNRRQRSFRTPPCRSADEMADRLSTRRGNSNRPAVDRPGGTLEPSRASLRRLGKRSEQGELVGAIEEVLAQRGVRWAYATAGVLALALVLGLIVATHATAATYRFGAAEGGSCTLTTGFGYSGSLTSPVGHASTSISCSSSNAVMTDYSYVLTPEGATNLAPYPAYCGGGGACSSVSNSVTGVPLLPGVATLNTAIKMWPPGDGNDLWTQVPVGAGVECEPFTGVDSESNVVTCAIHEAYLVE